MAMAKIETPTSMMLKIVEYCVKEEWNFVLDCTDETKPELSVPLWGGNLTLKITGEWTWEADA